MTEAYVNQVGTAIPPHDVHGRFIEFALSLLSDPRQRRLFERTVARGHIDHRYSFLPPGTDPSALDAHGLYRRGRFAGLEERMRLFERHAPSLAAKALDGIDLDARRDEITHLIVACCTGFYAPGLDVDIIRQFRLRPSVERTTIGFMGCYAAVSALKLARHIVRSDPGAKVVVVNIEFCTLHFQEQRDPDQLLLFSLWGDGCAASLVSAEPTGIELRSFHSSISPGTGDQMAWRIGSLAFDMVLSGRLAATLAHILPNQMAAILGGHRPEEIGLWAVHPGGRAILDAVETAMGLAPEDLAIARGVLRRFGNMSSATIMFVLKAMLDRPRAGLGCGVAFGPGLVTESMMFEMAAVGSARADGAGREVPSRDLVPAS